MRPMTDRAATTPVTPYDPRHPGLRPFHSALPRFLEGSDSPRGFLERCIAAIEARDADIKAFTALGLDAARSAADAAGARYAAGHPLSALDGMPVAVKDVIETEDLPTEHGSDLFKGRRPDWDAACVYWLRKMGAVVLGKTVTAEFATRPPGVTRNPWDLGCTPGGSSSGSGAAVGAAMAPVALGTQVRGSVLRPAAYCGTYALKPSYGVVTLQGVLPMSRGINHLGTLAASLEDTWLTIHALSRRAGGEPGHPPLPGATEMPAPARPTRLIFLETAGWARTPDEVKATFRAFLDRLAAAGVEIMPRSRDEEIEAFETDLAGAGDIYGAISAWEGRYPLMAFADRDATKLTDWTREFLAGRDDMDPDAYGVALKRAGTLRRAYAGLAEKADACITLTAPGPAPFGFETGDPVFCDPFSVLHVPALNLPLLAVEGMPLGVQLTGFFRDDARLVGHAAWLSNFAL
jgi:Asp-tRNA(Asn)/Glu-tRNA(Gln) amidotransferase A subunit family amidase